MDDPYEHLRSLPFTAIAPAVGIDLSKFITRKNGQELYGPCPLCRPKFNHMGFRYHQDGHWKCYLRGQKGRGAIDFIKKLRQCGLPEAMELLAAIEPPRNECTGDRGRS